MQGPLTVAEREDLVIGKSASGNPTGPMDSSETTCLVFFRWHSG